MFKFAGKRPNNLGVTAGKLASCPSTPNCVCSQIDKSDPQHYIEPITYEGSPQDALTKLKGVIQGMERTAIITEEANYVYAEFTSKLMGFVDDVEFYLDETENVIQVRSASRLGKSDLGVNRQRAEEIRKLMV
jgi:uncharacterized protein (DUF1499 family)